VAWSRLEGLGISAPPSAYRHYAAKQLALLLRSLALLHEVDVEEVEPATVFSPGARPEE
jgi:hypothetical protein